MSGVSVETLSIPLPGVTVQSPSRRGEQWRLTVDRFIGRGSTLKAAKADLARQITATIETVNVAPAFALDDDGTSVIVALARPWGVDEYRVTGQGHKLTGCYSPDDADPAALLARTHHYTVLPDRTGQSLAGAPRPRLFTMEQVEKALSTARERAHGLRTDQGALDIFQDAAKALLIDPDSPYPLSAADDDNDDAV
ncbi:hypothetical protein ABT169_17505 [Streptomyces sp. NPDC001616]|uniref:hypothetical protein n=1 Tax=Streptomyces sp. NPDC001616 TaxID=3156648 RepID=UPI003318DE96